MRHWFEGEQLRSSLPLPADRNQDRAPGWLSYDIVVGQQGVDAIAVEHQLKGWSCAKKEALIRGDHDAIKILAKRRS